MQQYINAFCFFNWLESFLEWANNLILYSFPSMSRQLQPPYVAS